MTRVIVSVEAEADINGILDYLALHAGLRTAAAYGTRFADAIERLGDFPGIGTLRPALGTETRITVVYPFVMIYDFAEATDVATLLRVLHGKREITEQLLKR